MKVAAFVVGLAFLGSVACSSPNAIVVNDLDFDASIFTCSGSNTVTADPLIIMKGTSKSVLALGNCEVSGPASQRHGVLYEGPYLGCLIVPKRSDEQLPRLHLSDMDRTLDFEACHR